MLSFVSRIGLAAGANLSPVADLEVRDVGGQSVLYVATRRGGILQAFSVDEGGATRNLGAVPFDGADAAGFSAGIAFIRTESGQALLYGGGTTGALKLREVGTDGTFKLPADVRDHDVSGDIVHALTVELASGKQVVFGGLAGKAGLAGLVFSGRGGFERSFLIPDTDGVHANGAVALGALRLGGRDFLFSAGGVDQGVTAWIIGGDGALTPGGSLSPQTGLWINGATAIETVVIGDRGFVIVAASGSGSISVMEVGKDGGLTLVDHVLDDGATRFANVSALDLVTYDGAAYLVAGGSDGGVSVFRVLPDGRLLAMGHIEGSRDFGLDGISTLALSAGPRGIEIFVTSLRDTGIGHYLFTPPSGDVVAAPAAGGAVRGGSGADIVMDGAGEDTLWGGAGADVFIFRSDGRRDTIADFELGKDRIDISAWGMIRDLSQLVIERTAMGFTLRYGAEELVVITAGRTPVDPRQLTLADLVDVTRIPPVMPDLPESIETPGKNGTVIGTEAGDRIEIVATPTRVEGRGGNDTITGGKGADTLFGGAGNDLVSGGLGNDQISGDEGNDTLYGGGGRDTLDGGTGHDMLYAGAESSILYGGDGDDFLYGGALNDRLYGGAGNDHIAGSRGNDLLYGGTGNDLIYGASGNDQLYGGDGDDTLYGSLGRDRLFGGLGQDLLYGEDGADRLVGDGGADTLYGGGGNDALFGGSGNDIIYSGLGADYIVGGSGADRFVFTSVLDSPPDANRDKIMDFSTNGDKIDLSAIDARPDLRGNQSLEYIGYREFGGPGQLRLFTSGGHTVVQVDIDGDGRTDMNIVLMDVTGVSASDFIL